MTDKKHTTNSHQSRKPDEVRLHVSASEHKVEAKPDKAKHVEAPAKSEAELAAEAEKARQED